MNHPVKTIVGRPLLRLCRDIDANVKDVLELSETTFRALSKDVCHYDVISHALVWREWKEARKSFRSTANQLACKEEEEGEDVKITVIDLLDDSDDGGGGRITSEDKNIIRKKNSPKVVDVDGGEARLKRSANKMCELSNHDKDRVKTPIRKRPKGNGSTYPKSEPRNELDVTTIKTERVQGFERGTHDEFMKDIILQEEEMNEAEEQGEQEAEKVNEMLKECEKENHQNFIVGNIPVGDEAIKADISEKQETDRMNEMFQKYEEKNEGSRPIEHKKRSDVDVNILRRLEKKRARENSQLHKNDTIVDNNSNLPLFTRMISDREDQPPSSCISQPHNEYPQFSVGSRYFIRCDRDCIEYPVTVQALHSSDKEINIRYQGYRSIHKVLIEKLLPVSPQREKAYQIALERRKEIDDQKKQQKRRSPEEQKKRRVEEAVVKEKEKRKMFIMYGPPTSVKDLPQIGFREGHLIEESLRRLYIVRCGETPVDIARRFDVDIKRLLYDNSQLYSNIVENCKLKPLARIVLPPRSLERTTITA